MSTAVILTCDDCGHSTPATSPTMAAYALRRHSCATVRERAARGQRRLNRLALSGPEQPCQHNDRHPHGNRVRYVIDKCRCRPCRDAARAYEQARSRARAYGKVSYVSADPARAHVRALQAQGMGWQRIARHAGISCSVMWKLLYGDRSRPQVPSKRIRSATEAAILGVTLDLGDAACVDGTGTRRRLQALVAVGWPRSQIATRIGMARSNFGKVIQGTGNVYSGTAKAAVALYDELWDQTPTRGRARSIRYATLAHWAVPMAWDTETIDDPTAKPDLGEHDNLTGGKRIHVDDIEFLIDQGLTIEQAAHRLGVVKSTIEHACARGDRRDLLARMIRNKTVQEYAA